MIETQHVTIVFNFLLSINLAYLYAAYFWLIRSFTEPAYTSSTSFCLRSFATYSLSFLYHLLKTPLKDVLGFHSTLIITNNRHSGKFWLLPLGHPHKIFRFRFCSLSFSLILKITKNPTFRSYHDLETSDFVAYFHY